MTHDIGEVEVVVQDARFDRLPRWAQDEISRLTDSVNYWRAKTEVGPEDSNTFLHEYTNSGQDGGTPLGTNSNIRFELNEGQKFIVHLDRNALQVYAGGMTGGDISVRPMSSNTVRIEMVER